MSANATTSASNTALGTRYAFATGNLGVVVGAGNNYVGTTYLNGAATILNAPQNAITGDVVLTGGNNLGTDSLSINNSALDFYRANQIADTATVTLRGGVYFRTRGFNETVANMVFESPGGTRDGWGSTVFTGAGTLRLTGNITAQNLDDVRVPAWLGGNLWLPAATTVSVDTVKDTLVSGPSAISGFNGQIGLGINANLVSATTINKTGSGVLQLGGVSYVQNTVNVNAGALVLGGGANYGLTQVNVGAGAILDMRGQTMLQVGSVIGAGTIKNFHAAQTAATLITGADNTDGTFSGTFVSDFQNALLSVRKMGTGNWTLSGDSSGSLLGTLTVANGTLTLASATAKEAFQTYNFQKGATLLLDNTSNAVNFRLGNITVPTGATTTLQPQGGELVLRGNGATAVREAVQTLTPGDGGGIITLNAAGTPGVTLALSAIGAQSATSSLLIRADSLSFER